MFIKLSSEAAARVFGALADPTRLAIVMSLTDGEKACADLVDRFGLNKSTFSHHTKVLARCGLVRLRRGGKYLYLTLNEPVLRRCLALFGLGSSEKEQTDGASVR